MGGFTKTKKMITITQGYDIDTFYTTTDGQTFEHFIQARIHQKALEIKKHDEMFMKNRNWVQRFFNIQPPYFRHKD